MSLIYFTFYYVFLGGGSYEKRVKISEGAH